MHSIIVFITHVNITFTITVYWLKEAKSSQMYFMLPCDPVQFQTNAVCSSIIIEYVFILAPCGLFCVLSCSLSALK